MHPRMAFVLGVALWSGLALGLDELVPSPLSFDHCPNLIVPVLIHTVTDGGDLDALAALVEADQDIWFTDSHHLWFDPPSLGILVDLLRTDHGGTLVVAVVGADETLRWERAVPVAAVDRGDDVTRSVVPVSVPQAEGREVFPRSGIYRIVATSAPSEAHGTICGATASTSIVVELAP